MACLKSKLSYLRGDRTLDHKKFDYQEKSKDKNDQFRIKDKANNFIAQAIFFHLLLILL